MAQELDTFYKDVRSVFTVQHRGPLLRAGSAQPDWWAAVGGKAGLTTLNAPGYARAPFQTPEAI